MLAASSKPLKALKDQPLRFLTAAALFDGHDAAINVIRRVLQDQGCEVIHLGHNRGVEEVARAAIQEDVDGIAISSYQGGHMEYFEFLIDTLKTQNASHIQVFGGGGGVILPDEKKRLEHYGVSQIFLPEDGMRLGLEGMIQYMCKACEEARLKRSFSGLSFEESNWGQIVTAIELGADFPSKEIQNPSVVVGITGTGGAGKSSLVDELVLRFLFEFSDLKIAIYSVDPTKRKTGGALLGDRIRMNSIDNDRVFMRSIASRGSQNELSSAVERIVKTSRESDFDLIFVETLGIGQGGSGIVDLSDISLYVMTSDYGASTQLEKIDMLDFADIVAVNKFERRGSEDALREVRKQYARSRKLFEAADRDSLPIFGTRCNIFNDVGVTQLYERLRDEVLKKEPALSGVSKNFPKPELKDHSIIPADKVFYLGEIVKSIRSYKAKVEEEALKAHQAFVLKESAELLNSKDLEKKSLEYFESLEPPSKKSIETWRSLYQEYEKDRIKFQVREKTLEVHQRFQSLSGLSLKRVTAPRLNDWGDILRFRSLENLPGHFPFTAGIYPMKRDQEDPRRQFAGEGPPARTNERFHYLSRHDKAKRLSTAFDSVTLYGEDPDVRPDIYGKVGESGVSIATLKDMGILYRGFDLCDPQTSVSMTINGPAPILLAMYLNTAIIQQVEKFTKEKNKNPSVRELEEIKTFTLKNVRGTVQADILKEDQAQNTCIFSTEFALKMMGDIQEYFISNQIRNYYSVSISGYHIAEAGANPISQLAFTLSNGFTLVEYYLHRGMKIDDFAPNLSFFFSNGLDPEYSVIGRVARRIWAVAMKHRYGANERSQKLKYHIQTSGRSLHAAEMEFNDIRTTLQALTAIYDNCNSLHTNAYDEAITTPTIESVRRAMAIQMIIEKEFGTSRTENFIQGSYVLEELTQLVEEAVLSEFEKISNRGGVLGAMETQYQRSKIQEESLHYEKLKHSGELPLIGVNTFLPDTTEAHSSIPLSRSNKNEKDERLLEIRDFHQENESEANRALESLKKVALSGENIFAELMKTVRVASLGQITHALYEVGGRYRRNM
jgi:methylmalonyl-CoA mutase